MPTSDATFPGTAATPIFLQQDDRPHVLVIEDEEEWGKPIVRALTQPNVAPARLEFKEGDADYGLRVTHSAKDQNDQSHPDQFNAELVDSSEAALMYAKGDSFDIFIVDLKLKTGVVTEGLALVSDIRRTSKSAGIIVYSGEDAHSTAVPSIVSGANFYLQKPLNAQEIRKATSALWKHHIQHQRPRARIFQIGEWRFTFGRRTLVNEKGEERILSSLEYAFLINLIVAEDHEIERTTFAKHVLGGDPIENDRRIDSIKKRLMGKLGETVQIIQIREHGYKLLTTA